MMGIDEKQQFLLDQFYKKEKLWGADYYLSDVVSGIILSITMIMLIMPVQLWEGDVTAIGIALILELMGMECYVRRYLWLRENGVNKSVYQIVRLVPVSRRQFVWYILKKLLRLCFCLTGVSAACQVVFALAFLDTFSVWNLLAPAVCSLFLPMVLTASTLLWQVSSK